MDVLAALGLILLVCPIWLLTALAIKLTSPGPLLFIQTRGGRGGRPFRSYKFRSMRANHVHDPNEMVIPLSHPAITAVGKIIRRTKIDESPQLINVLKGDMSLIGPRPTIMEQVNAYNDFQRRRLAVRPGITGLAQVNGNTAIPWDERIQYDVWYVDHLSFMLDLKILLKTIAVLVLGESRFARPFAESPYAKQGVTE